jgi:hypothetical protein
MYADDGFLYSENDFTPIPPTGLDFAEDKSQWIQRNGIAQVKKNKFLGVKYDFEEKLIEGATKNGSTLKFGPNQLDLLKLISKNSGYSDLMTALVRSGI